MQAATRSTRCIAGTRVGGLLLAALMMGTVLLLSGCAYPKEQRLERQVAIREHLLVVQNAVDEFKRKNGVLPIQTTTMDKPLYEKYPIDFRTLKDRGFLSQIPTTAFENGGGVIYVLIDAENKPQVRAMDLAAYQTTDEIQQAVDAYRRANSNALPVGERLGDAFYRLDFAKLGRKTEQVLSPYSPLQLGFILHNSGMVAIDYAPEIAQFMTKKTHSPPDGNTDLRIWLVEESPYVPVKSYPYYWRDNQPQVSE